MKHLYLLHEMYDNLFCPIIFIPFKKIVVAAAYEIDFMTHCWDMNCNLKTTSLGKGRKEGGNLLGDDGIRGDRGGWPRSAFGCWVCVCEAATEQEAEAGGGVVDGGHIEGPGGLQEPWEAAYMS